MALDDITKKILAEAQSKAAKITAAAEKAAAEKLAVAQKQIKTARQKAEAETAQDRARSIQQRRQLLAMETEQKVLACKREYLAQVLQTATETVQRKKLKEFLTKVFRNVDFQGARVLAGGDGQAASDALKTLGVSAKVVTQKDWADTRVEVDYGRARLDCSVELAARDTAQKLEAELAGRLWK